MSRDCLKKCFVGSASIGVRRGSEIEAGIGGGGLLRGDSLTPAPLPPSRGSAMADKPGGRGVLRSGLRVV